MLLGPRSRISSIWLCFSTLQRNWRRIYRNVFWSRWEYIMSRSLPHPRLRPSSKICIYYRPMRLPVWRFGWGRNTAQERYGTVLHRASICGDGCWTEHGIQVFYCACFKMNYFYLFWNVKPGQKTWIYGRTFCFLKNIERHLRHNRAACYQLFFRIMGQIQVLPKQTKTRREKWVSIVPHLLFRHTTHTNSCSSISK